MIDSGLVTTTDFHSSHPQGRGAARADDAQGTPTQSHISPSIQVYEENTRADSLLSRDELPGVGAVL